LCGSRSGKRGCTEPREITFARRSALQDAFGHVYLQEPFLARFRQERPRLVEAITHRIQRFRIVSSHVISSLKRQFAHVIRDQSVECLT
jgi:hypothetical protein